MTLISYTHTYGVLNHLKKDLAKASKIVEFIIQIIFLFFCGYSIYSNIDNTLMLTIYIILTAIAFTYFIFYLVTNNSKTHLKLKKNVRYMVKYSKMAIRVIIIGISVFNMIEYGMGDFEKVLLIVSGVSFILQIIMDIVIRFTTSYINLLIEAVKMDYENSKLLKAASHLSNLKGMALEAIDVLPEKLADKKIGEKESDVILTDKQIKLREKINEYKVPIEQKIEQKKIDKNNKESKEIKTHIKTIFSRKKN